MPVVDMPINELKAWRGRSVRPADFDLYWDCAVQEMRALDPGIELVPADFHVPGAECFDLWYSGIGGARIHAKYLRPAGRVRCPAVLEFHGYSCSSGDWSDKLGYLAAGFCVAALDCRGQGGLSEDVGGVKGNTLNGHITRGLMQAPDQLLYRQIYLDTAQLAHLVMGFPEVDETRVCTTGGSQGGGLALACAALVPEIARTVAQYPFLCDFRRVWEMDLAVEAYEDLRNWFRLFDPLHQQEAEIFSKLDYIDVVNLAGRVKSEVLMVTGLVDTICPPSTQFAAYNQLRSPKQMMIYPDFGHEAMPGFNDAAFQFLLKLAGQEK